MFFGAKVKNMESPKSGRAVPNQLIITEKGCGANGNFIKRETFQSYDSIIAVATTWKDRTDIVLDENTWDYSNTTRKYRNEFLGMDSQEVKNLIDLGQIKLEDLNPKED